MSEVDEILSEWRDEIGNDYTAYENHVNRVVLFCCALGETTPEQRRKITIAASFHDLGIWTDRTFDYLPPSIALATRYLERNHLEQWIPEITLMIAMHHKVRGFDGARCCSLVERFRRGDLIDLTLGAVRLGLPKTFIADVRKEFPNRGFHKRLVELAAARLLRHPLSPLPMLKW